MDVTEQISQMKEFLEDTYKNEIVEIDRKGIKQFNIDFIELAKFNPDTAEDLLNNPEDYMKIIKLSLEQFDIESFEDWDIGIFNLTKSSEININRIRKKDTNKLISIKGVVTTRTKVFPRIHSSKFECPVCGDIINVIQIKEIIREPTKCGCGRKGKFKLLSNDCQTLVTSW